jgi:hypothetical protein
MKLLWLLLLAAIAWRLWAGRWPWQPRRGIAGGREREQARNLLGVGEGAGRDEIIEAHRRLVAMVHPDRGGSSELVHEANSARDLLLGGLATRKAQQE